MLGRLAVTTSTVLLLALLSCLCLPAAAQAAEPAPGAADNRPAAAEPAPAASSFALSGVHGPLLTPFEPLREPVRSQVAAGNPAGAADLGTVDWGRKLLVARGQAEQQGQGPQAEAMARRGASLAALRNAAALAGGIRIGPNGRVAGLRDGTVRVNAFIKGFEVTEFQAELINGKVFQVAEARLPLYGVKSLAVELHDSQAAARTAGIRGLRLRRVTWVEASPAETVAGDVLIIDARGTGFAPSLFPVVSTADQQVLIDMQTVGKDVAAQEGICACGTSKMGFEQLQSLAPVRDGQPNLACLPQTQAHPFLAEIARFAGTVACADEPAAAPAKRQPRRLVVKAAKAEGDDKTRLVMDNADAEKLRNDGAAAALVKGGKVLVIVDAAAAGQEGRLPDLDPALRQILAAR